MFRWLKVQSPVSHHLCDLELVRPVTRELMTVRGDWVISRHGPVMRNPMGQMLASGESNMLCGVRTTSQLVLRPGLRASVLPGAALPGSWYSYSWQWWASVYLSSTSVWQLSKTLQMLLTMCCDTGAPPLPGQAPVIDWREARGGVEATRQPIRGRGSGGPTNQRPAGEPRRRRAGNGYLGLSLLQPLHSSQPQASLSYIDFNRSTRDYPSSK